MPDDLDKFLRQAAQRRAARQRQPEPQRLAQRPPIRPVQPPPEIEILEQAAQEAVSEHVSAHVDDHMNTGEYERRAAHMGEEVGLADDKVEAHLHQVFDHDLGSLKQQKAESYAESQPRSFDTDFSAYGRMLGDPQALRLAVILSEILQPPSQRWA